MRSILEDGHSAGVFGRVSNELVDKGRVVVVVASTLAILLAIANHVHGIIGRVVLGVVVDRGVIVVRRSVRIAIIAIWIIKCSPCRDAESSSREEVRGDAGRGSTACSVGSCRATSVVVSTSIGSGRSRSCLRCASGVTISVSMSSNNYM